ncbi:hypothetical protein ACQ86D_50865 [Streptomyces galilaeus]
MLAREAPTGGRPRGGDAWPYDRLLPLMRGLENDLDNGAGAGWRRAGGDPAHGSAALRRSGLSGGCGGVDFTSEPADRSDYQVAAASG